ncbi:hypothetical protein BX600DRAFT_430333 [Xylariales sp. PMI_506]|nr:hypothetical protein BX600DRAFT_430333 [Xylariales sp. PMI_506]
MDDSGRNDKGLLDRLNALKPTTVNLQSSLNRLRSKLSMLTKATGRQFSHSPEETGKSATRDPLSERLKTLRNQSEFEGSNDSELPLGDSASALPPSSLRPVSAEIGEANHEPPAGTLFTPGGDVDPLLATDDQTLEELLEELGADEQWLEEVAAEVAHGKDEDHQRVIALLDELHSASPKSPINSDFTHSKNDVNDPASSDGEDDSDGEQMKKEVDHALMQAVDEAEWESRNADKSDVLPLSPAPVAKSGITSPRSGLDTNTPALPAVPSKLTDQPETEEHDDGFEADIASRMAALRGLGSTERSLPSAPTSAVDELSLPGVPAFAPGERPVKGVYKRPGFTDEDMKTWCTVCLEDGTVRCIGCDNDVYCTRCWKEMHVGPRAGYDERGHSWEKFVKER